MSANAIVDHVPIGSIIAWSDGTPKPPRHHYRRCRKWRANNGAGRLSHIQPGKRVGDSGSPPYVVLYIADDRKSSIVTIRIKRTPTSDSDIRITVLERPAIGSVGIYSAAGSDGQFLLLADDLAAARRWLSCYRHSGAVLEEVTADEVAAAVVEGRTA